MSPTCATANLAVWALLSSLGRTLSKRLGNTRPRSPPRPRNSSKPSSARIASTGKKSKSTVPVVAVSICPSCGATIEPPSTVCEACTPTASPPPVRSLWRLVRFARPRAAMITLGLILTLASTAATLVVPYITMLLINNVLTPHEQGQAVDFNLVKWYLGALVGSALLAWMLNWAKTYSLSAAQRANQRRSSQRYIRAPATTVAGIFRRQAHRRFDFARRQRHRPHLQLPVVESARFHHRRSIDRDDRGRVMDDRPSHGPVRTASIPAHRLAHAKSTRSIAARLRAGQRRLGRNGQRARRHDPRHPRRQSIRPRTARNRPLREAQSARAGRE